MIAVLGYPGGSWFAWRRFRDRRAARRWLDDGYRAIVEHTSGLAHPACRILSEAEARRWRYSDGSGVFEWGDAGGRLPCERKT